MIIEFLEWTKAVDPAWVGVVVYLSTVIAVAWGLLVLTVAVADRIGAWCLLPLPAFIAYCFYIAVFTQ